MSEQRWPSEMSGFLFFKVVEYVNYYLCVYQCSHSLPWLQNLCPLTLCVGVHICAAQNQRPYPKQQEVKLCLAASLMEYWEIATKMYYLNSSPTKDKCHTETSAKYQVILLSCDFLSFPSLHQLFRGQEDLSVVTERIMGVGIPLAVITALSQHLVLSLPLFSSSSCLSVSSLAYPLTE